MTSSASCQGGGVVVGRPIGEMRRDRDGGPTLVVLLDMLSPYWIPAFERLQAKGWRIQVILARVQEQDREYDRRTLQMGSFEVVVTKTQTIDLRKFGSRTAFLHLQVGLLRALQKARPDVILASQLGLRTLVARIYGGVAHVPVVPWLALSTHTERHNSRARTWFRRLLLRGVPAVCTNGEDACQYVSEVLHVPPSRVYRSPYAIDVEAFRRRLAEHSGDGDAVRREVGPDKFVMLFVGQMIPRKGISELVAGLECLDNDERRKIGLLLIGGDLPRTVEARLAGLGIEVIAPGFVQPRDLYAYFAASDALVFPSLEDEWGVVVNEAAAAGLPIAGSIYAGAVPELVRDGVNGVIFDARDPHDVSRALRSLLHTSAGERRAMARASLAVARAHDLECTVRSFDDAATKAIQDARRTID